MLDIQRMYGGWDDMRKISEIIFKILEDELGYIIIHDADSDVDLTNYLDDSIKFIQFITAIEEEFDIELDDDFLSYEIYSSLFGFIEKLEDFIEHNNI